MSLTDSYSQTSSLTYDDNGNFSGEIPVLLNGTIKITKEGYKNKLINVSSGNADLDLGIANIDQITYNIAFNGNNPEPDTAILSGSTASMTNVGYFTSTQLNANGFAIKDKINGEVCESFEGWAITEEGEKVYDDKGFVESLTSTDGDTVTLYGK